VTPRASAAQREPLLHPVLQKARGDVRERVYTGRVWCFTMPSGFIWTRRAHKDERGVVTKASRALLTGQCPPEAYFGERFTDRSDLYSVAVILWEMANRCIKGEYNRPFYEFPNLQLDFQIIIQVGLCVWCVTIAMHSSMCRWVSTIRWRILFPIRNRTRSGKNNGKKINRKNNFPIFFSFSLFLVDWIVGHYVAQSSSQSIQRQRTTVVDNGLLCIRVEQAFGNCPQYINERIVEAAQAQQHDEWCRRCAR
jgi:hypothetical protein